jgi:hypothetical protein
VVGGAIAGVILGPSLIGALAPTTFEAAFVGGAAERERVEEIDRRHEADRIATETLSPDPDALIKLEEKHREELAEPMREWRDAQWAHQRPLRIFAAVIVAMTLLGAGMLGVRERDRRQHPLSAISIGLWSALLPGGLACAAMIWFWQTSFTEAALTGGAVAIGPWALRGIDRDAANDAEFGGAHLIQAAGRLASMLAIAIVIWFLIAQRGNEGAILGVALLALPLGWLLEKVSSSPSLLERAPDTLLVPWLAALVGMKVHLYHDFTFWMLLALVILSGDARWFGAFLGAMLPGGRRALRTMRLVLGSMACGPTQLAIAALAAHAWAIDGRVTFGLLLGAVIIEATAPARRSMARRLVETEEEMDELGT